jgi:RNA polymerase sigma-70 factor (ECF subfamily)
MAKDTNPEDDDTMALALAPAVAPAVSSFEGAFEGDEDKETVRRAQAGDRAAFALLFKKHHGRVHAMCTRMLSNPAEVDDAVQQSFLEAWRCLHRFEGRSRFTTWITRVAIHTCFSTRRRLKRMFVSDVDAATDRAAVPVWQTPGLAADEVASRRAREVAIASVLQSVGPKKRAVFVLADLEGMSSTEIAEILEVPDATVRTRLFHARREVAALIRSHPGFVDVLAGRSGRSAGRGTPRDEGDA